MTEGPEDPFTEAAYDAFRHAESPEEALKTLAFSAGVEWPDALRNICHSVPEVVIRESLAGILVGLVTSGRADTVMAILKEMTEAAIRLAEGEDL